MRGLLSPCLSPVIIHNMQLICHPVIILLMLFRLWAIYDTKEHTHLIYIIKEDLLCFFPFPSVFYRFLCTFWKLKKKRSKSAPTEAPLSRRKHWSWNASSLWHHTTSPCHTFAYARGAGLNETGAKTECFRQRRNTEPQYWNLWENL